MKDGNPLLVESRNGLARVTLNRPHRRNAFDASMVDKLYEAFDEMAQDSSVRAIVLTGTGSAFCAGADLNWMGSEGAISASEAQ
ncbi:MAG TPA: enoyl-CoA hydratase-related protein, partial [Nitrospira sp.]|nr:enoyl-CoA hydratase-related protein [Nitrospira sp.]